MAIEPIPIDLREFILEYIDSIAQLEALLLLRRHPDKTWDAGSVAGRLYISVREASELLTRLSDDGFLIFSDACYRFSAQSAEQRQMVDQLADAYSHHLIHITNMIHSKPRRIREFSDAFRFRKDRS